MQGGGAKGGGVGSEKGGAEGGDDPGWSATCSFAAISQKHTIRNASRTQGRFVGTFAPIRNDLNEAEGPPKREVLSWMRALCARLDRDRSNWMSSGLSYVEDRFRADSSFIPCFEDTQACWHGCAPRSTESH